MLTRCSIINQPTAATKYTFAHQVGIKYFSPPLMKWLWQHDLFLMDKVYIFSKRNWWISSKHITYYSGVEQQDWGFVSVFQPWSVSQETHIRGDFMHKNVQYYSLIAAGQKFHWSVQLGIKRGMCLKTKLVQLYGQQCICTVNVDTSILYLALLINTKRSKTRFYVGLGKPAAGSSHKFIVQTSAWPQYSHLILSKWTSRMLNYYFNGK